MALQLRRNFSGGVYVALGTLLLLGACGWVSTASAGIIINDTWQDNERATQEYGVDTDSDGNIESAWFNGGASVMSTSVGSLNADLNGTSANWTTYFTPEGSEVLLANNGDNLKVTWQFKLTGVNTNTNTSQDFRFALVDTQAGNRLLADGTPVNSAFTGYSVFANMRNPNLANSNPFQLRERTAGSNPLLNNSGDWGALGNGATAGNHGYDNDTLYTLLWTITRNGAGLDVTTTMSGGTLNNSGTASVSVNDPNGNGFKFDTFNVRPSSEANTADKFATSLFKVESNTFTAAIPPVVNDFEDTANLNETIATILTASGTDPKTWGPLTNPTYVPDYGAEPDGLGAFFAPNWNPLTQQFSWNTQGSSRGHYTWDVAATNAGGSDTGKITIHVPFVPEPTSLVLVGLAMVGVAASVRRRS